MNDYEKQSLIVAKEKEYRSDEALNFTAIKDFDEQGPFEFYKRYVAKEKLPKKESDAMDLGSLIDCLLTTPETFDDRFFIISADNSVTGQSKELVEEMFRLAKLNYSEETDEVTISFEELFRTAFETIQIDKFTGEHVKFKNKSWEKVLETFTDGPMEGYYDSLLQNISKKGVTFSNVEMAKAVVTHLKSVPAINEILNPSNSDIEVHMQFPVYFKYKNFAMKGLLDIVHINYATKTIHEFDLKTSWSVMDFASNRIRNKYYLQEAVYHEGLTQLFPGYKVEPRKYIVADSRNHIRPFVAKTTNTHLAQGYDGFDTPYTHRRGINELIEEISWHFEKSMWNTTKKIYEGNDEISLEIFGE